MTDFTSYPRQDLFETQLASGISSTQPTIGIVTAPDFTLSSGSFYLVIDPEGNPEICEVTNMTGTTLTVTRGVALYEGGSSSATSHAGGVPVIISNNWKTFDDIQTAIASKANIDNAAFTGSHQIPTFADATARDADIPAPANGMECYNIADGKFQDYTAGSWVDRESGGTFANASETVAGKVEIATDAEVGAGTTTGGTGAQLAVNPGSVVKTSSGAGDENKLAALNASGQLDNGFINSDTLANRVSDVTATATEINDALDGISANVTAANLSTNTGGGQSTLHKHALSNNGYAFGVDTWDPTAGTDTKTLTHNLGFTPSVVKIKWYPYSYDQAVAGQGIYNGSSYACLYVGNILNPLYRAHTDTSHIIYVDTATNADIDWNATVSSMDSTDIVLDVDTYTNQQEVYFIWEAFA